MYGEHRFLIDGAPFSAVGKPYSASLKLLPPEASMTINQNDHMCRILASQKVLRVFTEHGVIRRPGILCRIPEHGVLFTAACTENSQGETAWWEDLRGSNGVEAIRAASELQCPTMRHIRSKKLAVETSLPKNTRLRGFQRPHNLVGPVECYALSTKHDSKGNVNSVHHQYRQKSVPTHEACDGVSAAQ